MTPRQHSPRPQSPDPRDPRTRASDSPAAGAPAWRISQDPRAKARILEHARWISRRIHVEMLQEWSAAQDGPYPRPEDAERRAMTELGVLCRGLEELVAIDPREIDEVARVMHRNRPRRDRGGDDFFDDDWY
ncbi:hypothetical protein [Brachybacterium hainanense]|uniref:Uncharacterized protein n=1 Tax=Brachybacterium hainanense TaxID=1541174 RepID=A0ABV6RCT5_9MICO